MRASSSCMQTSTTRRPAHLCYNTPQRAQQLAGAAARWRAMSALSAAAAARSRTTASSAAPDATATTNTAATTTSSSGAGAGVLTYETDPAGRTRVKYAPEGWRYWQWRGHRVHYIEAGLANTGGPTCLLVHGYGASAYHWRYMIPALEAAGYRVFAMCLLGFGMSDKALVEYGAGALWADQIADFAAEVAQARVVVAGNSLGGYAAMVAAARRPELFSGLVLLNAAGPVAPAAAADGADAAVADDADDGSLGPATAPPAPWWRPLADAAKRAVLFFAFQRARRPERIREVLNMVYASNDTVDDDLVESIRAPATDANAAEVFYRIQTPGPGAPPAPYADRVMRRLRANGTPTLLLWGAGDVWIRLDRAKLLKAQYPEAKLVVLDNAGHCPHDDAPEEAAAAVIEFVGALPPPERA